MNKINENILPKEVAPKKKKSFGSIYIKPILDGTFLSKESAAKELPFISFLLLLIILFISNTFFAQNTARRIYKYKQEVKELRLKSISVKSKLMDNTRRTVIIEKVKDLGLIETLIPPQKIFAEKK